MLKETEALTQIRDFINSDDFAILTDFIQENYVAAALFENTVSCLKLYLAPVDFTKKEIKEGLIMFEILASFADAFKEVLVKKNKEFLKNNESLIYLLAMLTEAVFVLEHMEDPEVEKYRQYFDQLMAHLVFGKPMPDLKHIAEQLNTLQRDGYSVFARIESFALTYEIDLRHKYGVPTEEIIKN